MNLIWLLILISSTVAMLFSSPDGAVTALLGGATNAVNLALSLIASYGFWLGFFKLLEHSGIGNAVTRLLRPVIRFLFRGTDEQTEGLISLNMSANLLGLGNASTAVGISAISQMDDGSGCATDNQIMLIVLSATSLQLLPSTVIGMRIFYGSLQPTAFLLPCMIATVFSTVLGVALCKLMAKLSLAHRKKNKKACKRAAARS